MRFACLFALAACALSIGCSGDSDETPGYALFESSDDIGEVGRGDVGQGSVFDGEEQHVEVVFLAPADKLEEASAGLTRSFVEDGWQVQDSADPVVLSVQEPDDGSCIRYVDLLGDTENAISGDPALALLDSSFLSDTLGYGAAWAVVIDPECAFPAATPDACATPPLVVDDGTFRACLY